MDLKEFVKDVLVQINGAVDEARLITSRDIHFTENGENRTVDFDIAVSAEKTDTKSGKTGIKVLQFAEAGGNLSKETKNSTVSRVSFGVRINPRTKQERVADDAAFAAHNASLKPMWHETGY